MVSFRVFQKVARLLESLFQLILYLHVTRKKIINACFLEIEIYLFLKQMASTSKSKSCTSLGTIALDLFLIKIIYVC